MLNALNSFRSVLQMSLNAQKYIYFFLKSKLMQISKIQYWELDVFRTSDFREFGNSYTWPTCFAV